MKRWKFMVAAVLVAGLFASCEKEVLPEQPETEQQEPEVPAEPDNPEEPDKIPETDYNSLLYGRWKLTGCSETQKTGPDEIESKYEDYEKEGKEIYLSFLRNGVCFLESTSNGSFDMDNFLYDLDGKDIYSESDPELTSYIRKIDEKELKISSNWSHGSVSNTYTYICKRLPETEQAKTKDFAGTWIIGPLVQQIVLGKDYDGNPLQSLKITSNYYENSTALKIEENGGTCLMMHKKDGPIAESRYFMYNNGFEVVDERVIFYQETFSDDDGIVYTNYNAVEAISPDFLVITCRRLVKDTSDEVFVYFAERKDLPSQYQHWVDFPEMALYKKRKFDLTLTKEEAMNEVIFSEGENISGNMTADVLDLRQPDHGYLYWANDNDTWITSAIQRDWFDWTWKIPALKLQSKLDNALTSEEVYRMFLLVDANTYDILAANVDLIDEKVTEGNTTKMKIGTYMDLNEDFAGLDMLQEPSAIRKNLERASKWEVNGNALKFTFKTDNTGEVKVTLGNDSSKADFTISDDAHLRFEMNGSQFDYKLEKFVDNKLQLTNKEGSAETWTATYATVATNKNVAIVKNAVTGQLLQPGHATHPSQAAHRPSQTPRPLAAQTERQASQPERRSSLAQSQASQAERRSSPANHQGSSASQHLDHHWLQFTRQ